MYQAEPNKSPRSQWILRFQVVHRLLHLFVDVDEEGAFQLARKFQLAIRLRFLLRMIKYPEQTNHFMRMH